jgi:hypothetical protein
LALNINQSINVIISRLPVNCFVILSTQPQFPHLVAMETHLTCVIPCIEQEDFVSMVRDLTVIALPFLPNPNLTFFSQENNIMKISKS